MNAQAKNITAIASALLGEERVQALDWEQEPLIKITHKSLFYSISIIYIPLGLLNRPAQYIR